MERRFELVSPFAPTGDQPEAIEQLLRGMATGDRFQTLLGATGTGKTFTMANVIARSQRPTLIMSHNKTLAAQLYEEMRQLFPHNAVSYFVSYYDYYQPEAYIPQRDIFIEKDASRNEDLDRLRLAATSNLLSRPDTIVVASVSCLYGLGSPHEYMKTMLMLERGMRLDRRAFLLGLADMQYARNDVAPERGNFRVRGDCIEVFPANEQVALRIETFGDQVDRIEAFDPISGELLDELERAFIFPAVHYVTPKDQLDRAMASIKGELDAQVLELQSQGKLLEAQRLLGRTKYDLEMIAETGACRGIENYSRHMEGRAPGSRSYTLLDYFRNVPGRGQDDWLMIVDESHVTIPQVRGMYFGDRKRKETLVEHGFRLPSALDNRPLTFEEWQSLLPQAIFVSATPSPWELEQCGGVIAEQVIRPTGLVDPPITLRPARGQVADLLEEVRTEARKGGRTLVTALTKRLCEELTNWFHNQGVRVRYLHSEIETLERLELLRALREGDFDCLVGVNLLREGLDLPEVSLVAILDADKQGFLRSTSALIQTMGRAARNAGSRCLLYADGVTPEMQRAIDEVERRRAKQLAYNERHGIVPRTIEKAIRRGIEDEISAGRGVERAGRRREVTIDRDDLVLELHEEMMAAAGRLEFERAARLRDEIERVKTAERVEDVLREPGEEPRPAPGMPGTKARKRRKPDHFKKKSGR